MTIKDVWWKKFWPRFRMRLTSLLVTPRPSMISPLWRCVVLDEVLGGRYRLASELGRGGMGVIYRAHDDTLDRPVAVKILSQTKLGTEGRARLLQEARAAAQLNHPNIVSVHDAGEDEGTPFIVMELVEGKSLFEHKPDSIDEIVEIAKQICIALGHAHEHDIVHRDLKPENVLIADDGTVKLMDFGLARSIASRVTSEGVIVGTVFYLAPEQAQGQAIDGRADLYSLGVMLYELTTGRLPFTAEDPLTVISQHLHSPPIPPRAHMEVIPSGLNKLIVQLLSKRPEDRPASAAEVGQALETIDYDETRDELSELSLLDRIVRGRIVGREGELMEAMGHWQRAVSGEGHVLLVSGEPGIGKTRLIRELGARVEMSGGTVWTGECYAEGGAPYSPLAQIIRQASEASDKGKLDLPDFVIADLITLAPDLRSIYPEIPQNPSLDSEMEQQRIFESFVAFCGAYSERAPLVLFIDDIHWADAGSLYLLRHLVRRAKKMPLLIVATYREVELDEARPLQGVLHDLNRERLAARLKITRLSQEETGNMLESMLAVKMSDDFVESIYRETEGNPFFIEEVCKTLIEEGKIQFRDGEWCCFDIEDLVVPQSVRVAIQSRVGKLPEPAQEALRLGAILGNEFEYEVLKTASELDEEELITALEAAERGQLIHELRNDGEVNFAFAHALIPSTLRESVSGLRRQRMHAKIAEVLESWRPNDFENLAHHHSQAGHLKRARSFYLQAGDRARNSYASEDAARFYQAALERWSEEDRIDRAATLIKLGDALGATGNLTDRLKTMVESLKLYQEIGDSVNTARVEMRIGGTYWALGERQASLEHIHKALSILENGEEITELAQAISMISRMHMLASEYDQSIEWGERALKLAKKLNAQEVKVNVLNTVGVARTQKGDTERGLGELRESLRLSLALDQPGNASRAYYNLSELLMHAGRYSDARATLDEYIEHSQRTHSPIDEALALLQRSLLDWQCGRWGVARDRRSEITELLVGIWSVWATWIFGWTDNDVGRSEEACIALEASHSNALRTDEIQTIVPYLGQLARAYAVLGRESDTDRVVNQFLDIIDGNPYFEPASIMPLLFACQWFALRSGKESLEAGRLCAARLASASEQMPSPVTEAALAEAKGTLLARAEGKGPSAVEYFRNAAETWETLGRAYDQARALGGLGRTLAEVDDPEAALVALDQAMSLFDNLAEQLEDEGLTTSFLKSQLVEGIRQELTAVKKKE